jgi:hypothetical protein
MSVDAKNIVTLAVGRRRFHMDDFARWAGEMVNILPG